MDNQSLGGRHKKSGKRVIHVGKIFAEWCGHCKTLKPEWEKMKRDIKLQLGRALHNVHVEFVEIGDTEQNKAKGLTVEGMLQKFNASKKCNTPVKSEGYPTLFKVYNGNLEYYTGPRDANSMFAWYTKGLVNSGVKKGGSRKARRGSSIANIFSGFFTRKNRSRKSRK
jgi:thiol-disulfide isomerase/thioredoxin